MHSIFVGIVNGFLEEPVEAKGKNLDVSPVAVQVPSPQAGCVIQINGFDARGRCGGQFDGGVRRF